MCYKKSAVPKGAELKAPSSGGFLFFTPLLILHLVARLSYTMPRRKCKMKKNSELTTRTYTSLLERIAEIFNQARVKVIREINRTQVLSYWEIGREVVEFEQKGKARAEYGEELVKKLSIDMTEKLGRGFSEINLRNMRRFYLEFPIKI